MTSLPQKSQLVRLESGNGVGLYELKSENFLNNYYIVSTPESRRLMASPEVVGYDSYLAVRPATEKAIRYLQNISGIGSEASILTILRGGLNYPVEECCHSTGIQVNNINFISCERVIEHGAISGLDIRYEKFHIENDCTLMIGDIIATGDTLRYCMSRIADDIKAEGGSLKNIIFFTIGGTRAISLLEELTSRYRELWPGFQGIRCFFYEGIFSVYQDKGVTGVNFPDIDFGWKDGVISPEFRSYIMDDANALFEKCIIYDGGARRYEIPSHYHEVTEYWETLRDAASTSSLKAFIEEKTGYRYPISYGDWLQKTRFIGTGKYEQLYEKEMEFIRNTLDRDLTEICDCRLNEFRNNMEKYNK